MIKGYTTLMKVGVPTLILGGLGILALKKCVYSVDGGHLAIKFSRLVGLKPQIYREGWHLMIPYFERPIIYDVRTRFKQLVSKTGSKDLQMVDLTIRVLYRPLPNKLVEVYRFVGKDFDERVLPSIVNEVVKTIIVRLINVYLL